MTATSKKTPAKKPTTAQAWRKNQNSEPLQLPSGNYMRVRRMGMQAILKTGKVPNSLMSMMRRAVDKGTGTDAVEKEMAQLVESEEGLMEMANFMDTLVTMVALEPKVALPPPADHDRAEDILYTDELEDDDKNFIFQYVTGGTDDVETFRNESRAGVASLSGRADLALPAQ